MSLTRPFGQALLQELRELARACDGYVVVMLTDRGVWRVMLDGRGKVLRLMTGRGARRQAEAVHAARAADVVLTSAFGLGEGRLLETLSSTT